MNAGFPEASRARRIAWHEHPDEIAWASRAAAAACAALESALDAHGAARVLLSGGSTPAPIYRALADAGIEWGRVEVGLVDERDVDADAGGSNARLLRSTLLHGRAAAARFTSLRDVRLTIAQDVAAANARWHASTRIPLAVVVLGMGDDGHTASLFPGAVDLDAALASREPYAAIDATGCAVAGAWTRRISLTPAGLSESGRRLLLIRGAEKRTVLERALASGGVREMPIRAAFDLPGTPLDVHWCA